MKKFARNWTFIVYPDSVPKDWKLFLDNLQIEFVCSPIHNIERPHYHILLKFNCVKSFEEVLIISKILNGSYPNTCHNVELLLLYF